MEQKQFYKKRDEQNEKGGFFFLKKKKINKSEFSKKKGINGGSARERVNKHSERQT